MCDGLLNLFQIFSDAGKLFVAWTVTVCKFNKHTEPGKETLAQLEFDEAVARSRRGDTLLAGGRENTLRHQTGL